jgi:catechol 2,3-dioxygenase-like lactoylglutathione lyase family enzyme
MMEQQLSIYAEKGTTMTEDAGANRHAGPDTTRSPIQSISALTLATHDMARSVRFYRALGFVIHYGGESASFTSLAVGSSYLNIVTAASDTRWSWWGRAIFHVADVDALYAQAIQAGLEPSFPPSDASWGERYFHLIDPDGHELSFARPLNAPPSTS